MRHQVQIALIIRVVQVDGGRRHLIAQRQYRDDRLDGAGGTQQVTGHRLGGADHQGFGMLAKHRFHAAQFGHVTQGWKCRGR